MTHVLEARLAAYRETHTLDHYTDAALQERVTPVPCRPRPMRDGWWHVGYVVDELADKEWDVWHRPGGTLAVSERPRPEPSRGVGAGMVPVGQEGAFRGYAQDRRTRDAARAANQNGTQPGDAS